MVSAPKQHPFQQQGTEFLRRVERGLLADAPRLGKTNQALLAAEGKTLAISAAMVEGVWADEYAKWEPNCELYWVSYGNICKREADARGRMTTSTPFPKADLRGPWDTVILDEAHNVKNPNANWTQAIGRIKTDRLFLLTGTPIPNWAHELLTLLRLMYPGDRRFTNRWNWINRWFKTWQPPWGGTKIGDLHQGITWTDFHEGNGLVERLLLRTEDDVGMQLPPLQVQTLEVDMAPEQARVYKQLRKQYIAWVESTGTEVVAFSDGALHTQLDQLTTGLETLTPGSKGSGKLAMCAELLRERAAQPVVLACTYRNTARALEQLCDELKRSHVTIEGGVAERPALIRSFQDGKVDTLIGTLDTISEGLNLSVASTSIRVERSWRPSRNHQFNQRMWELGNTKPVLVIDLFTRGTLDARRDRVLGKKTDQQVAALPPGAFVGAV